MENIPWNLRELSSYVSVTIGRGLTFVTNAFYQFKDKIIGWFGFQSGGDVGEIENSDDENQENTYQSGDSLYPSDDEDILEAQMKEIFGPNYNQDQPILELMEDSDENTNQSSDDE